MKQSLGLTLENLEQHEIDRFYSNVEPHTTKDGCDIWNGALIQFFKSKYSLREPHERYGQFSSNAARPRTASNKTRTVTAHRWAYAYHYGEIPPDMDVAHLCDNPRCVRPDHLALQTRKENVQHSLKQGRNRFTRIVSSRGFMIMTKRAQAMSEAKKRMWANPTYRARQKEARKRLAADPLYRARQSEAMKKAWAEGRHKLGVYKTKPGRPAGFKCSPETKALMSASHKRRFQKRKELCRPTTKK